MRAAYIDIFSSRFQMKDFTKNMSRKCINANHLLTLQNISDIQIQHQAPWSFAFSPSPFSLKQLSFKPQQMTSIQAIIQHFYCPKIQNQNIQRMSSLLRRHFSEIRCQTRKHLVMQKRSLKSMVKTRTNGKVTTRLLKNPTNI